MRGLYIHAHIVSQLLSAVEDRNRPLIWWWPWWGDALWILVWSAAGAMIGTYLRSPLVQVLGLGLTGFSLYGLCWLGLAQLGWLPLVPALVALGMAAVVIALFQYWHHHRWDS